jgi:hypothetical protein
MMINYHTGLTFSAHSLYGGIRFYNQGYPNPYDPATGSVMVMSMIYGNVGIGTTTPNGKLDVNGAILLPGSSTNTMARTAIGSARIPGEISGYSGNGLAADDGFLRLSAGGGTNSNVKSFIDLSGYSTVPDMDRNIILGTGGAERMRIYSFGNVSIGIADPQGYMLAVNGSAIATSVTVKLHGSWPDYVFKKDYQLPSLLEVKTYIDQNQHLPDMPSAAEVEKNGINLGDIVRIQTKKIEELTLYAIDQQKQLELLKLQQKVIQAQQEQINKLQAQLTLITNALSKN